MSSQDPLSPQQIEQAIEEGNTEFPLEVRLETGQVYRGQTPQDVLNQLVKAQTEASRTIQQERIRGKEMEKQLEELKAQIPPPKVDASDADKQVYYETWAKDPDAAFRKQMAKTLGVSEERVPQLLKEVVGNSVVNRASDEFLQRCPDFPQSPENAQMIARTVEQLFGTGPEAASANNLELAYHRLVREGQIVPNQLRTTGLSNPNSPIPNLRGGSAPPNPANDVVRQFQGLSLEKMKETLERLSAQMGR